MLINQTILEAARSYLRDNSRRSGAPASSNEVISLMDHYQLCCKLSHGGNPDRCEHYEVEARIARNKLCTAIGYCQRAAVGCR